MKTQRRRTATPSRGNHTTGCLIVRDVMTRRVRSVQLTQSTDEAAAILQMNGISGAPVLNEYNDVVGVLSSTDILRRDKNEAFRHGPPDPEANTSALPDPPPATPVAALYSPGTIAVSPESPLCEVARLMLRHRVHRVVVLDDGQLVGIVSTMDALWGFLRTCGRAHGHAPRRHRR
jgi:CBS domain-containing protein